MKAIQKLIVEVENDEVGDRLQINCANLTGFI